MKPANQGIRKAMKRLRRRIEAFAIPDSDLCAVDREAREASRLYFNSWIMEDLRLLDRSLRGDESANRILRHRKTWD